MIDTNKVLDALRYPESVGVIYQCDLVRDIQDQLFRLDRIEASLPSVEELELLISCIDNSDKTVEIIQRIIKVLSS